MIKHIDNIDELGVVLKDQDEFIILHIDNKIEVKITRSDMGYIVDVYKELPQTNIDNHDFDSDFIDSITVWDMDLESEEE